VFDEEEMAVQTDDLFFVGSKVLKCNQLGDECNQNSDKCNRMQFECNQTLHECIQIRQNVRKGW
jgi:hypothetical protein